VDNEQTLDGSLKDPFPRGTERHFSAQVSACASLKLEVLRMYKADPSLLVSRLASYSFGEGDFTDRI
jgi:hypothetical protein